MKKILIIFLIALVLRLGLVFVAYHGDLNNNISWGNELIKRGLNGFFEQSSWPYSAPNQPPLYILLFGLISFVYQQIDKFSWYLNNNLGIFPSSFIWFWEQKGMILLVKLPSILADLGIGFLIYKITKKINLTVLWLFNPIIWYNSSIWGQTDAIVNLIGLAAIFYLIKKKFIWFAVLFTLSLLFKGSLAIFVPVLFIYALFQRYKLKVWVKAGVAVFVTIILVCIWFHPSLDLPIWLIDLYNKRILPGEIGYLTANAFNFWWLVNPGKVLDSTLYFGLPARIWGYLVSLLVVALVSLKLHKNLFWSLAVSALATFLFMTRIHERYLYPFFPVGTILIGFMPEFVIPLAILSVTNLLNLYHLFWAPPMPFLEQLLKQDLFKNILSIINLAVFGWILVNLKRIKAKF